MKPKAIFFDVDGTIIPLKIAIKTFQETCKHFDIKALTSKKLFDNAIGYTLKETINKMISDAIPIEKEFEIYFEELQIKNFKKYGNILPFVKSTFYFIYNKGIKIGIVTTKRRIEAVAILSGYKLSYNDLVAGDDVKERKPSPEPTLKACKNLKLKPKDCIFVGDHPFDMMSAKSAGCLAIGVLTGWGNRYKLKKSGADYIIKDLRGLKELIE